jgi:hypothetical protein
VFYCHELDKYIVGRLLSDDSEKDLMLFEVKNNSVVPEDDSISMKSSGTAVKRILIHKFRILLVNSWYR